MNAQELYERIIAKRSFLCVGLDTDRSKIPEHLLATDDPIFEFNKQIIDATSPYCVAYKPNIAFYEKEGAAGWESLRKTLEYIPSDLFTIADAKRGDIGNTASMYAETFFNTYAFDSVTVAPYMGKDSVSPFLQTKNKWAILLALTSNPGALDFQQLDTPEGKLYEAVIRTSSAWGNSDNMMYVVGATRADYLKHIRSLVPDHFFLVPGVGAQGGDLRAVAENGFNQRCGLLVNSSRGIIYAGNGQDFKQKAAKAAQQIQSEMEGLLKEGGLLTAE
jgi:orotidine-5'-phosphate decarboxylase